MSRQVLLTGATGFIGKLVLRRLLEDPDVQSVYVLVRPADDAKRAEARVKALWRSLPLADLPPSAHRRVHAVPGDMREEDLGLTPEVRRSLERNITHVVHLAASVRFDLPGDEAAGINVDGALHIQALAEAAGAKHLVYVSTAYVHPSGEGPHRAELVPLPAPVGELLAQVRQDADFACARTGHPNSYTITKCLAEHMLIANQKQVPVTLVRPSIVSVAWRWPVPGWVDSSAAHAGVIAALGSGLYRVLEAKLSTRVDLVPVDVCAEQVVDSLDTSESIVQVVAGPDNSPSIEEHVAWLMPKLRNRPVISTPRLVSIGPDSLFQRSVRRLPRLGPYGLKSASRRPAATGSAPGEPALRGAALRGSTRASLTSWAAAGALRAAPCPMTSIAAPTSSTWPPASIAISSRVMVVQFPSRGPRCRGPMPGGRSVLALLPPFSADSASPSARLRASASTAPPSTSRA